MTTCRKAFGKSLKKSSISGTCKNNVFSTQLSKLFSGQLECSFDKPRENFSTPCEFFLLQDPGNYGKTFCSKNINSNYSSRQLKCSLTTMLRSSQQTSETFGTICLLSIKRFIFDPKKIFPPKGTLDTWIVFLTPHPPCWKDLQKSEILLVQGPKKTQEQFSRKRFSDEFFSGKLDLLKNFLPKSATFSINFREKKNLQDLFDQKN